MNNRYFIIDSNDANLQEIYSYCVEDGSSVRKSTDGTLQVVKLPKDYVGTPECLSGYTEYDHTGIIIELAKPEWQEEE